MFGRGVLVKLLVGLLVIALLVGGVSATQRNAWTQGYLMGRAAAGSDGGEVAPVFPYGYPGYASHPGMHFGGLGLILGFGLLALLVMGAMGRAFRHRAWAMHGGPQGGDEQEGQRWAQARAEHAARHWRHGWPRCWDREAKAEPPRSETAEATSSDT